MWCFLLWDHFAFFSFFSRRCIIQKDFCLAFLRCNQQFLFIPSLFTFLGTLFARINLFPDWLLIIWVCTVGVFWTKMIWSLFWRRQHLTDWRWITSLGSILLNQMMSFSHCDLFHWKEGGLSLCHALGKEIYKWVFSVLHTSHSFCTPHSCFLFPSLPALPLPTMPFPSILVSHIFFFSFTFWWFSGLLPYPTQSLPAILMGGKEAGKQCRKEERGRRTDGWTILCAFLPLPLPPCTCHCQILHTQPVPTCHPTPPVTPLFQLTTHAHTPFPTPPVPAWCHSFSFFLGGKCVMVVCSFQWVVRISFFFLFSEYSVFQARPSPLFYLSLF